MKGAGRRFLGAWRLAQKTKSPVAAPKNTIKLRQENGFKALLQVDPLPNISHSWYRYDVHSLAPVADFGLRCLRCPTKKPRNPEVKRSEEAPKKRPPACSWFELSFFVFSSPDSFHSCWLELLLTSVPANRLHQRPDLVNLSFAWGIQARRYLLRRTGSEMSRCN